MSGRNPPSYCTLTLIAMQGHQQKGRQTNTSSNNKDKSDTTIETSTAEDHDDENLHNPSTRPRYSPGSRRRAVGDHKAVRGKRKELGSSLHTCQGYDTQMLLMHGLSYGPALTRNTKERASVCQSDQVGLRPPRVTSHTILTRTLFSCMSFIPNCMLLLLLFLTFSALVANPEKNYFTRWPIPLVVC